jgi:hypothetical protein
MPQPPLFRIAGIFLSGVQGDLADEPCSTSLWQSGANFHPASGFRRPRCPLSPDDSPQDGEGRGQPPRETPRLPPLRSRGRRRPSPRRHWQGAAGSSRYEAPTGDPSRRHFDQEPVWPRSRGLETSTRPFVPRRVRDQLATPVARTLHPVWSQGPTSSTSRLTSCLTTTATWSRYRWRSSRPRRARTY